MTATYGDVCTFHLPLNWCPTLRPTFFVDSEITPVCFPCFFPKQNLISHPGKKEMMELGDRRR